MEKTCNCFEQGGCCDTFKNDEFKGKCLKKFLVCMQSEVAYPSIFNWTTPHPHSITFAHPIFIELAKIPFIVVKIAPTSDYSIRQRKLKSLFGFIWTHLYNKAQPYLANSVQPWKAGIPCFLLKAHCFFVSRSFQVLTMIYNILTISQLSPHSVSCSGKKSFHRFHYVKE